MGSNKPQASLQLSPYETLYGRAFLSSDILLDTEATNLLQYVISLRQFLEALGAYRQKALSLPTKQNSPSPTQYPPGSKILTRSWKDGSPTSQLAPLERALLLYPFPQLQLLRCQESLGGYIAPG